MQKKIITSPDFKLQAGALCSKGFRVPGNSVLPEKGMVGEKYIAICKQTLLSANWPIRKMNAKLHNKEIK